ncbi:hypothetical protein J7T55_014893 [Diaporthe amygdali]|uniref:uncharacterized protein n=1 Tax=Phomopsis amygdali TaxID=1214568 RepID=UPI0022FE35B4|nr:uncharacterized protein J7T55_014893 [Diaporthe amygdali]KAJ0110090.1 hypothetical protein J7T55_014893 [Diaporthe amygdali]
MKFSSQLLLATSTVAVAVSDAGAPCYFANGDLAEGYHTCDVKSPVSSCCPAGYTCSSTSSCSLSISSLEGPDLAPGTVPRSACTDPRWNSNFCGGKCLVSLDSGDATGAAGCDPVDDSQGGQSCCAGGNASGSCICSSNAAKMSVGASDAQTIVGRKAASFSRRHSYSARGEEARLNHPKPASPEASSSEMFPVYSTKVRTSSPAVSTPVIIPVTPSTWIKTWSGATTSNIEDPTESATNSQSGTITSSNIPSTDVPRTTTISIIASSLTRSSFSSLARITPTVPTVTPILPEGATSDTSRTSTSSLPTKLGLGLGIPLIVLAVALLTACIYRRQRRLHYSQAPPFDFNAPEVAPVSAADFPSAFHGGHHTQKGTQQQAYRYGPPRDSVWSEWGAGAMTGRSGRSYDDNQVGSVDRSRGYHGYEDGREVPEPGPGPSPVQGYEDLGSPYEDLGSPYEDRGHTYLVPAVQVYGPQREPAQTQEQLAPRRASARVSRGLSVNEEVSPLSSTGSGMPYPRVSGISGLGWEAGYRGSR